MTPLYPPTRPLPISKVLDSSFTMFKVSFVRCLAFGPLWIIVGQLPNIYHLAIGRPRQSFGGNDPVWWGLYVLGAVGSIVVSAALILHQRDIVSGVPTKAVAKLLESLRRLPVLLGFVLLSLAVALVPVALAYFSMRSGVSSPSLGTALVGLIIVIFLSYLSVLLTIAWTALLIDRLSPIAALRYAYRIVSGNWWRTFAVMLVAFVVMIYIVVATVVIPLVGSMELAIVAAVTELMIVALSALIAPYFGATMLALYGDLKARREGTDLEARISAAAQP
jgi:hypothetical protein